MFQVQPHFCSIELLDKQSTPLDMTSSSLSGTIIPSQVLAGGCGGETNPLVLEALPGQQFYITMTDFYWSNRSASSCDLRYGTVYDFETRSSKNLCGGKRRDAEIMLSHGNKVKIVLHSTSKSKFLIQYEGKLYTPYSESLKYTFICTYINICTL